MINAFDVFNSDNIDDYKNFINLVVELLRDTRFSKSEVSVYLFCLENYRSGNEIADFIRWKPANAGRVLLSMYNKNMLNRIIDKEYNNRYMYISNREYLGK